MSASCTCRPERPIQEDDIITRVRYDKHVAGQATVWVYYRSHLYNDEKEYNCVKMFYWGSRAEEYRKYVEPIVRAAPDKGGRYFTEWFLKASTKRKADPCKKENTDESEDEQLSFI